MTGLTIIRPYRLEEDADSLGGLNGQRQNLMLLSGGGTDKLMHNIVSKITQSNADDILLSPSTTTEFILLSGTTDKLLISGGTDKLLKRGYSSLLLGRNYIRLTNI